MRCFMLATICTSQMDGTSTENVVAEQPERWHDPSRLSDSFICGNTSYSPQDLLNFGYSRIRCLKGASFDYHELPAKIKNRILHRDFSRWPTGVAQHQWRKHEHQFWERANPHRTLLTSVFLDNVQIQLWIASSQIKDCSMTIFTETWLNNSILDGVTELRSMMSTSGFTDIIFPSKNILKIFFSIFFVLLFEI